MRHLRRRRIAGSPARHADREQPARLPGAGGLHARHEGRDRDVQPPQRAASWYHRVALAARRTGFDAPLTGASQTLQFLADFDGPDFHCDLWDGRPANRQTPAADRFERWAVGGAATEFFWNADYTKLIWGETPRQGRLHRELRGTSPPGEAIPSETPPWLYGEPVDMERVGTQAQPIRDPGPTDNTAAEMSPPENPAPAFPHREESGYHRNDSFRHRQLLPAVAQRPRRTRSCVRRQDCQGSARAPGGLGGRNADACQALFRCRRGCVVSTHSGQLSQ